MFNARIPAFLPRVISATILSSEEISRLASRSVITATRLADKGCRVVVVSTDKDLAQLVREDGSVTMFDLAKEVSVDADGVRQKFGVDPAQIPDFLGIVGDTVDNLPGVPGVGPKGAAAALGAFGRIEDVPADPAAWNAVDFFPAGLERHVLPGVGHFLHLEAPDEVAKLLLDFLKK